jgi:ComF family protein
MKYSKQIYLAESLASMWCRRFPHHENIDAIIPVPISKKKYHQRGFNQCNLLAQTISHHTKIPLCCNAYKIRETKPQVGISQAERATNLRGAFAAHDIPNSVAIIDDTITTGATMHELKKALLKAGCSKVELWAIAQTNEF